MIGLVSLEIRVRGRVQGVGFRPGVYRIALELGLSGEVFNDAEGVLIRASGPEAAMASFLERIVQQSPPLARVRTVETKPLRGALHEGFRIVESAGGAARTEVAPDAKICVDCSREILSPGDRRFRYAFTACTHCGPRLTVVNAIPYDRSATTMACFPLCAACESEYRDPRDRRFHAEATACPACGPTLRLVRTEGRSAEPDDRFTAPDPIDAAFTLLERGEIVAIKGLGGYHLACDATLPEE
jgi:hydrogenase maturation protein HypF